MIRLVLIVVMLFSARAHAEPGGGFDPHLASQVYASALAFMAPRILEATPVPQLVGWGLQGLSALDPRLSVKVEETGIVMAAGDRILSTARPPPPDNTRAWAETAATMASVAWSVSPALRRAGQTGVVQSFFDELFNHLDPYSRYDPPDEASEDRSNRSGVAGLGMSLVARNGAIVVRDLVADGPAQEGGLRAGDRIEAVDDQPTRGLTAANVTDAIAGPEGTDVTIAWRSRDGRLRTADFTRDLVPPETVFSERAGNVLVLRLTAFNSRAQERFAQRLVDGLDPFGPRAPKPPDGIVIDLRGNRGGLVRQAVETAGLLLPAGSVATTVGRDPDADHAWRSDGLPLVSGKPVVVLVDGRTASAAEILAAALADRGQAVVVGSATLGKGLVQTITPLPDGGELFVTWSRVLAPGLWPIQGLGVLPQVCTSLGQDSVDRQLRDLQAGQAPMAEAIRRHHQARAPVPPAQIVSLRSPCPSAVGREADLTVAHFLVDHPAAYASALLPPLP